MRYGFPGLEDHMGGNEKEPDLSLEGKGGSRAWESLPGRGMI